MSEDIEALGSLVTAGLAANALDPPGAPAAGHPTAQSRCANCGTALAGSFCGQCGQRAPIHRTLAEVGHELLHGITHFDGKAWTTLPMLLFRPGKLTRDYIRGHRARYIAPVPLFLLVVFLMFFVLSFLDINTGGGATGEDGKPITQAEAIKELPRIDAELRDLDRQIAVAKASGDTTELPGLEGARIGVAAARGQVKARAQGVVNSPFDIADEIGVAEREGKLSVNLGAESLNAKARQALKNPDLALYKIQSKAYKLSFLLVPLSLPWLWLLFAWKRDVRMYDHAIFALYSISFMSLLFLLGSIALSLNVTAGLFWTALIFLTPTAHMFVQLKGAYALTRFGAAWRTAALLIAAIMTLGIYATLMIALGVID